MPKWNGYVFDQIARGDMIGHAIDVMYEVDTKRLADIMGFIFGQPFTGTGEGNASEYTSIDPNVRED